MGNLTHSLFASPSYEKQPSLQFLRSLAAIPKTGGKKAGSELLVFWKIRAGVCIYTRPELNSANETKEDASQGHG